MVVRVAEEDQSYWEPVEAVEVEPGVQQALGAQSELSYSSGAQQSARSSVASQDC